MNTQFAVEGNLLILLLSPRTNPSSLAIQETAEQAGWDVRRLENWRVPEGLIGRDDVVAYGEPLFVAAMAEPLELQLIEPPFNWLTALPFSYIKRNIELTTLGRARSYPTQIFAKPADDKCFAVGVYAAGEFIEASSLLPENIPVLLSEVVTWEVEYRCFVLRREVQTMSVYLRNGELADFSDSPEGDDAITFAQEFLQSADIVVPPAVVVDVGRIAERGWAVIEANPVFGAGIYGCDPKRVLSALVRSIVPRSRLTDGDKRWIINREL